MRTYILLICICFLGLGIFSQTHAVSPNVCPLSAEVPKIPLSLRIERSTERILPILFMDPELQIRFYINRSLFHGQIAKNTVDNNPSLGYQELTRSINTITLLEKPIRSLGNTVSFSYEDIWKSIKDIQNILGQYKQRYPDICQSELDSLTDFLARDEKTLKKIYYESLLISTNQTYFEK